MSLPDTVVRSPMVGPAALLVVVALVSALLVACGDGDQVAASPSPVPVPSPSPSRTAQPSPTPSPGIAVDQVPDDPAQIDVPYGQAVIDAFDEQMGAVARQVTEAGGTFDEDSLAQLLSLYTQRSGPDVRRNWEKYVLPRLPQAPGPPRTSVRSISSRGDGCFAVDGERDLSPLGVPPDEVATDSWTISFRLRDNGVGADNPTAWVIDQESEHGLEDACAP